METNTEASEFFKWLMYIVAIYIIYRMAMVYIDMIFPADHKRTDKRVEVGKMSIHTFKNTPSELTPKEKACVAVGICGASDISRPFNPEEKHGWKHEIIMNAEKVFGKAKTATKKESQGKKKRR